VKIRQTLSEKGSGAPLDLSAAAPPEPAGSEPAASGPAVRAVDIRTSIRPTVAQVDLGAMRRNVGRLRAILGPGVAIYGVVKADAYGHGAVAVSRQLEPLCDGLAVSLVEEGLELRGAGIRCPVLVLGAFYDRYHSDVLEEGLTPVVYDPADLDRFAAAPVRRRPRGPAGGRTPVSLSGPPVELHLKVDTGMNRLGVSPDALPRVLERAASLPRLRVTGLCTHFASADVEDETQTREQLLRFERCRAEAAARGVAPGVVHAANSAAALRFPEARFSAVRPGVALYGSMPSPTVACPELEPVLTLRTRILALSDVTAGAAVSYGGRWRASRPSRIATVPIGYADGYPRHVEGAEVLVRGRRAPLAGAVCMDMFMVDVTDVPGVEIGDEVTLIGRDGGDRITIEEIAARAGTVNYEILCGLSKRVPRVYVDSAGVAPGTSPAFAAGRRPEAP
jgi:alanine racemase